jgi:hypothetical protein
MPLPNGVDPWGHIHPICPAASWMGNRGILHDDNGTIIRPWQHRAWITCALHYKERNRKPLMQPHRYSELFFLDEATAFSAGHRPCAECRNKQYRAFKAAWLACGQAEATTSTEIDKILHSERTVPGKGKRTFQASLAALPVGAMFALGGSAYVQSPRGPLKWTPTGYKAPETHILVAEDVEVLTPPSVLHVFRAGYVPQLHASSVR